MPRQARKKQTFGRYHIYQECSGARPLFLSKEDRDKFTDILMTAQSKFGFSLLGYNISTTNRYDLVLDSNGNDISSIMKSINIAYALYAKCQGHLFKQRYKSYLISEGEGPDLNSGGYVENTSLPSTAYRVCYNHVCYNPLSDTITFEEYDYCIQTPEQAKRKLTTIASFRGMTVEELLKDRPFRNATISLFRQNSILSLKELGQIFGGLSESSISKIINKNGKNKDSIEHINV